jgi:Raf kinase inhibitor-like YbhB/YbcL family protein
MDQVVYNHLHRLRPTARLEVYSSAFAFNGRIPTRYSADGEGLSPPLSWRDAPERSSMALIVEDADAPTPHPLVHAIVVNLEGSSGMLQEGALNSPDHEGAGLTTGRNSFLTQAWLPPDPPRGHGEHRYVFQIFALRDGPPFSTVPGRREFIGIIAQRAIAAGCVIGVYERGRPEIEAGDSDLGYASSLPE